jgi:hypothetical protein
MVSHIVSHLPISRGNGSPTISHGTLHLLTISKALMFPETNRCSVFAISFVGEPVKLCQALCHLLFGRYIESRVQTPSPVI